MHKNFITVLLILSILISAFPLFGDAGSSGLSFLKMPASAMSAATMTVFSPVSSSPYALFENPAGIVTDATRLAFSHNFWFADVNSEVLAIAFPAGAGSIGAGLSYTRIPGIEVRDIPSDDPIGQVDAQYLSAVLGYTRQISPNFRLGASAKYLYEKLYTEYAVGGALDIGALWQTPRSLQVSLMLQNLGIMNNLSDEKSVLPVIAKVGLLHPVLYSNDQFRILSGANLGANLSAKSLLFQAGTQVILKELLSIRGGFEFSDEVTRASLGLGIQFARFEIDYAMLFMPEGLGYPHLLSLTYRPK